MMHRCLPPILLLVLLGLTACVSPPPPPERETVPAAAEAQRLRATEPPAAAEVRDLRRDELVAARAAAQAAAVGNEAQAASHRRLAEELARLRAAAESRAVHQRQQMDALATEADRRAVSEQADLDQRAADALQRADARQTEARRQSDRRWAGWGLALAVVAGVALHLAGFPLWLSSGVPAAVAAGCLTLAAWSAVPWLANVLGMLLAISVVIALGMLVRQVVREWTDYAGRLATIHPQGKIEADDASRRRQPPVVRWLVDHLLDQRRNA